MVVFLDLEDDTEPPERLARDHWLMRNTEVLRSIHLGSQAIDAGVERENPNKEKAVTRAIICYPIIVSLASHIDLNSLDALSLTCRQIRANLLQYRTQLLVSTLHCVNEGVKPDPEHSYRYRARATDLYFVEDAGGRGVNGSAMGKISNCARDLVGECRRCGKVVCRNCTIKPPAPLRLRFRHRRLCKTCLKAPLQTLTSYSRLSNAICQCPTEGVYLCKPCGKSLPTLDSDYESIWKWRTKYLLYSGGLGVGIGEGDRGVECGRGGECLAVREVEMEVDCDAADARASPSPSSSPGHGNGTGAGSLGSTNGQYMGPGYTRHEIEGIGGIVKKKLVRMVRVGACVPEYEAEKNAGRFMIREQECGGRSWCGWCWRVVPGTLDGIDPSVE